MMLTQNRSDRTGPHAGLTLKCPSMPRILIVCDNDSDTKRLENVLREAGLTCESAKSLRAGCESAKSGRFDVVLSAPFSGDGSWERLIEVAQHYELRFEIVLLARSFNLAQWAEALQVGAFDVLDVLCDLPKAAVAAKRAFGAAYLRRFRSRTQQV